MGAPPTAFVNLLTNETCRAFAGQDEGASPNPIRWEEAKSASNHGANGGRGRGHKPDGWRTGLVVGPAV